MDYTATKLWNLIPEEKKKCKVCKCDLTLEITDVHHVDGVRSNNKPENLELICQKCHRGHLRPRKPSAVLVTIRMPETMLKIVQDEALESRTNTSFVIRKAIAKYYNLEEF